MPPNKPDPWYREGLRFDCRQCGNCCTGAPGYVYVTRDEIEKIATLIGRSVDELAGGHLRRVGRHYSLTEDSRTGDCCFLDRRDGGLACRIYPARPLQCRTWPFWPANLRSPRHWIDAAKDCPGINQGPIHVLRHIQACLAAACWEDVPQCPAHR